jgi:hypothetical protein
MTVVRLIRGVAAIAVVVACAAEPPPPPVTRDSAVAPGTPRPGIRFDPATIAPGTVVGVLTVDSIDARRAMDSSYVGSARFRGEIELAGATMKNPDPDLGLQLTCFEADSASAARLPRWAEDERRAWFCFSNNTQAAAALGPPSEGVRATIVIDEFTIHRDFSDAVNSARFIRLVSGGA